MYARMVDPWWVIQLYETMCLIVFELVVIGLAAECICMLFLCFRRETSGTLPFRRRHSARESSPKMRSVSTSAKPVALR
jgi:hypothetical protein